jgi:hypothetical protein
VTNNYRFYPHVGKFSRIFFMANDYCNKGYPWDGVTVLLPDLEDTELIEVRRNTRSSCHSYADAATPA